MSKLKFVLALQVIIVGMTVYWNGWIKLIENAAISAAKDPVRNATTSTYRYRATTTAQDGSTRRARDQVIFQGRRSDSMAQTHQCVQDLSPPPRVGTLQLKIFEDDVLRGKSCSSASGEWVCRDCGLTCQYNDWNQCPGLKKRKPQCNQNIMRQWSDPSINQVQLDPLASFQPSRRKIKQYSERPSDPGRDLEQIDCQGVTDSRCFNMSKCEEDILTVFSYPNTEAGRYLSRVALRYPTTIKVVNEPENACLMVLSCDYLQGGEGVGTYLNLLKQEHWNEGRNHFIWKSNRCFVEHQDYILSKNINFQRASLGTPNLNDLNLRQRFDMPMAYFIFTDKQEFKVNATLIRGIDLHRPRKYLIMFKALFHAYNLFWEQHRWLAFQYWVRGDPEILMDLKCGKKGTFSLPTGAAEYAEYTLQSTFAFCPGGLSPGSYRFHESLALQAIPVVTADFVAPFEPDLDWSGCLVRVSESRIADIPRLLRETYSEEDIRRRRERCQELFEQTVGWIKSDDVWQIDHGQQAFEMAMKVWAARVKGAFATQRVSNQIMTLPDENVEESTEALALQLESYAVPLPVDPSSPPKATT
jgi:hypothetical protein